MAEEKLLLDIPDFTPKYDENTAYGYKNKPGKNLEKLLRITSNNHCMYCYALLKCDRVDIGNLEHSIEKNLDEDHLTECVPNIALACPNCNQSLKRNGEKKRIELMTGAKEKFSSEVECPMKNCTKMCQEYVDLKKDYCKISKIIIQPFGVIGEKSRQKYYIQYDVYKAEFIPSKKYDYNDDDLNYIQHHITQFKLNDPGFKTKALVNFVEEIVNDDGNYMETKEYSNLIVDLFREKLKGMSKEKIVKLCEAIYMKSVLTFKC
ncbi:MAG: hypothetical protein KH456_13660 [Lachnospira eligens]|nr:hypothetical protein [Lachnospira eligens]